MVGVLLFLRFVFVKFGDAGLGHVHEVLSFVVVHDALVGVSSLEGVAFFAVVVAVENEGAGIPVLGGVVGAEDGLDAAFTVVQILVVGKRDVCQVEGGFGTEVVAAAFDKLFVVVLGRSYLVDVQCGVSSDE